MNHSNNELKAFQEEIEHSLGMSTWRKIVELVEKKYNITIDESISDFPKFHSVLSELFGDAAVTLEKRVLSKSN